MQFVSYDANGDPIDPLISNTSSSSIRRSNSNPNNLNNTENSLDVDRIEAELRLKYQQGIQKQFHKQYEESIQIYKQILNNPIFILAEKQLNQKKLHTNNNNNLVSRSVYYLQSLICKNLGEIYEINGNYDESTNYYTQSISHTYINNGQSNYNNSHFSNIDLKLFQSCARVAQRVYNLQLSCFCYEFVIDYMNHYNSTQFFSYFQLNFEFLENYIELLSIIGDEKKLLSTVKIALKINKNYEKGYLLLYQLLLTQQKNEEYQQQNYSSTNNSTSMKFEDIMYSKPQSDLQIQLEWLANKIKTIPESVYTSYSIQRQEYAERIQATFKTQSTQINAIIKSFPYKIIQYHTNDNNNEHNNNNNGNNNSDNSISLSNLAQSLINLYDEMIANIVSEQSIKQNETSSHATNSSLMKRSTSNASSVHSV